MISDNTVTFVSASNCLQNLKKISVHSKYADQHGKIKAVFSPENTLVRWKVEDFLKEVLGRAHVSLKSLKKNIVR